MNRMLHRLFGWMLVAGAFCGNIDCDGAAPAVSITNSWLVPVPGGGSDMAEILRLNFKLDRFWIDCVYTEHWVPANQVPPIWRRAIYSFDPKTGDTISWTAGLLLPTGFASMAPGIWREPVGQIHDVDARALWVFAGTNTLQRHDLQTRVRRDYPVRQLDGQVPVVSAANERVYLRTNDRFLELNPADGVVVILASSRRRPPVTPLDETSQFDSYQLTADQTGRLWLQRVGLTGKAIREEGWVQTAGGGSWTRTEPREFAGIGSQPGLADGLLFDSAMRDARILQLGEGQGRPLPLLDPQAPLPRWQLPRDYLPLEQRLIFPLQPHFDGKDLVVLAPPAGFNPMNPSPLQGHDLMIRRIMKQPSVMVEMADARAAPTNCQATLWWFQDTAEEPLVRHLELKRTQRGAITLALPALSSFSLQAEWSPEGVAMFTGGGGFWWLPRAQMDAWNREENTAARRNPRLQALWLARFDRNRDGYLDAEEFKPLAMEPTFHDDLIDRQVTVFLQDWDRDRNGVLSRAELDRFRLDALYGGVRTNVARLGPILRPSLFDGYDLNRDDHLDFQETRLLLTDNLEQMRARLEPFSMTPTLRPFDRNHDGRLDAQEIEAFLNSVEKSNFSLPLPPVAVPFDRNKDGRLDPGEEAEFARQLPEQHRLWTGTASPK